MNRHNLQSLINAHQLSFSAMLLVAVMGVLASNRALSLNSGERPRDRARIVLSQELPALNAGHLKATLVEVNYGPGEASPPHSHPCAVVAYVVQGAIRTQIKGEAEVTYHAGQSFYEAPNAIHLVSANGSSTDPAKLVAYLLCDHEGPLSVNTTEQSGATR